MTDIKTERDIVLKKVIDKTNYIIIVLFILHLVPTITFYLDGNGEWRWFLNLLSISLIFSLIPNSIIDKIQLSRRLTFYKRLKVQLFKKYATNGDIINKKIRPQFPDHRSIYNKSSIQNKLTETYTTEKAHLFFLLFCFLTSIYACNGNHIKQAIIITVGNIVFNLYPILLQQ